MTRDQMQEEIKTLEEGLEDLQNQNVALQEELEKLELLHNTKDNWLTANAHWFVLAYHFCRVGLPISIMVVAFIWLFFGQ